MLITNQNQQKPTPNLFSKILLEGYSYYAAVYGVSGTLMSLLVIDTIFCALNQIKESNIMHILFVYSFQLIKMFSVFTYGLMVFGILLFLGYLMTYAIVTR